MVYCTEFESIAYNRPHKRGFEQICLPLDLINAINPAVKPAQTIEDSKCWAFRPATEK